MLEEARVRSNVAFLALHGGSLERGTAEIATAAADRAGASLYAIRQPEDMRWHIPSHLADLDALPKLRAVLEHARPAHELVEHRQPAVVVRRPYDTPYATRRACRIGSSEHSTPSTRFVGS